MSVRVQYSERCRPGFWKFLPEQRFIKPEDTSDLLVLTFDGKGIVMRPDSLRECTRKNEDMDAEA